MTDKLLPTQGKTILFTYPLINDGFNNISSFSFLKAYYVKDLSTTGSSFLSFTFYDKSFASYYLKFFMLIKNTLYKESFNV